MEEKQTTGILLHVLDQMIMKYLSYLEYRLELLVITTIRDMTFLFILKLNRNTLHH